MDQIKQDNVPEEVRRAIESTDLTEKLLVIGKQYGLSIDQVGRLETLVMSVMTGPLHPNDFVGELEDALDLDDDSVVTSIASDVNLEIFLPVRQAIMAMHQQGGQEEEASEAVAEGAHPTRDSILDGIENPEPAVHPFSTANALAGGAAKPLEVVDDLAPKPNPVAAAQASQAAAQDFIAGKLTQTVAAPAQKTVTTPEELAAKQPEKPKGYTVDPYREPLM